MDDQTGGKRILFVITKASWGGAQRYVYDLALHMKGLGHHVSVAHGTEGLLVEKLAEEGIRTLPLPGVERDVALFSTGERPGIRALFSSLSREVSSLRSMVALLKEERPDILHVNSSKAGGLGALAGRLAGVKRTIFTAHGWAFNERRPFWQKLVFYVLYAATLWLSHATICVSEAIRRDMRWLPANKMVVVRHGMDTPSFVVREEARKRILPLADASPLFWIGMVAELHPTKRVEDAIDALSELPSFHPNAILVVLGEGEYRQALEERVAYRQLGSRVYLPGFVPDASRYLKAFDLFLMPSRTEALGLALVEAGYAGLPAIASRIGGIPEVVKHKENGLLVPPENPHALARAIRTLIEHEDQREQYANNLQEDVRTRFSKDRMMRETLAVYGF